MKLTANSATDVDIVQQQVFDDMLYVLTVQSNEAAYSAIDDSMHRFRRIDEHAQIEIRITPHQLRTLRTACEYALAAVERERLKKLSERI